MSHDQSQPQDGQQAEQPVGWEGLEPDTSERLYTQDELRAYSQRLESTPVPPAADPLNGPMRTPTSACKVAPPPGHSR